MGLYGQFCEGYDDMNVRADGKIEISWEIRDSEGNLKDKGTEVVEENGNADE